MADERVEDAAAVGTRASDDASFVEKLRSLSVALEESQGRFRQLADAMPFIVWSATPDGAVDYSNRKFFEYTGLPEDTEAASRWQPCVPAADLERIIPVWQRCLATESTYDVEFRVRRGSDGQERWHHVNAEPVRDRDGVVVCWYGTGIDVHESKLLGEQAASLARRLSAVLENVAEGFLMLDADETLTFVNSEAERLLRRARGEMLGASLWALFPQLRGSVFERELRRAREDAESVRFETYFSPLELWLDVRAYPSDGGIAVFFADITDRHAAIEQLIDQATLLDHAQDAIFVHDPQRKISYWNHGAERLLGWSKDHAMGRAADVLLRVDPALYDRQLREVIASGAWVGELELRTAQGQQRTVASRWSLLRGERGDAQRILVINTDITQQKAVEAQLLRAQRLESIGTLAGGIAHDLNNVLTPIMTSVSMLREGERDPDKLEDLSMLERCAQRGADMVRQLLLFARGTLMDSRSDINLGAVAKDVLRIVRDSLPKNIQTTSSDATDGWKVRADATQMHQLLMNLCVNARDAMPSGGALTISVEPVTIDEVYAGINVDAKPGPYVLLRVEDTGTGISKEHLDRIFDPFFTTKEIGKGTGLGLSTCHAIVRSHSGFIHVYSEVGRGTRFKVYFPAVIPVSIEPRSNAGDAGLARGNGELVLVVDDEEPIRRLTARTLERFGYRALTASHGAEAVGLYARQPHEIALVLTDMSMPVMDGPATVVALRSIDPTVKIIGCSGLDSNGKLSAVIGDSLDGFLAKPYSADALLDALRRALTKTR